LPLKVEQLRAPSEVIERLKERELALSKLIARRAVFSLCCQRVEGPRSFLKTQYEFKGIAQVLEFVFLALSEGLELAHLEELGSPARASSTKSLVLQLTENLSTFLKASGISPEELSAMFMTHCKRLLESSGRFSTENTNVREVAFAPGQSDGKSG
jgi:hypothetical protein